MDKLSKSLEDQLWDYLDGKLTSAERINFENLMRGNPALRRKVEEARRADSTLRQFGVEQPSKNFTSVVMGKLDQAPQRSGLSLRNGIFLLIGVVIVSTLGILLLSAGVFDTSQTTINVNDLGLQNKFLPKQLPKVF